MTRPRPGSLRISLLASALLAATAVPAASAAPPRCEGRTVLRSELIRVVDRSAARPGAPSGHRYVACARGENGRRLERGLRGSRSGARLEFPDRRGAFLAVRDPASRVVRVWDVAGERRTRLHEAGRDPTGEVVVTGAGEAAAVLGSGSRRRVVGFDYDGAAYTLDRGAIPARSLRRDRRARVTWTKGGRRRTADLSSPAVPCARLAGRTEERSGELNVVSFEYTAELIEGELGATTRRLRACALPGGPVRVLGEGIAGEAVQGGAGVSVEAVAGTYVLLSERVEDSAGDSSASRLVSHEVASGRRTKVQGNADAGGPRQELGSATGEAVITAQGQVASVFDSDGGEQLVGFDPGGSPRVLDRAATTEEIDERSLALSGTVLSWTRAGQRRSADLAAS